MVVLFALGRKILFPRHDAGIQSLRCFSVSKDFACVIESAGTSVARFKGERKKPWWLKSSSLCVLLLLLVPAMLHYYLL